MTSNISLIKTNNKKKDSRSSSKKNVLYKSDTQTQFITELSHSRDYGIEALKINMNNLFYYEHFYGALNKGKQFDAQFNETELSLFEIISMFNNKKDLQYFTKEDIAALKHKTYKFELRTNIFLSTLGSSKSTILPTDLIVSSNLYISTLHSYYDYGFNLLAEKKYINFNVNKSFDVKKKSEVLKLIISNSTHTGKKLLKILRTLIPQKDVSYYTNLDIGESKTAWVNDANIIKYVMLDLLKNKISNILMSQQQKSQLNDYIQEICLLIEYGLYYDILKTEDLISVVKTKLWSGNLEKFNTNLTITTFTTIVKILEKYIVELYNKITEGTLKSRTKIHTVFKNPIEVEAPIIIDPKGDETVITVDVVPEDSTKKIL